MSRGPMELMWWGFGIATVGFIAMNYVSFRMRKLGLNRRGHFQSGQWSMLRRHVGRWPLYTAAICIPAGIITVFVAIIYSNHLRLK
jgi:hypothetical protein